MDTFQNDFDKFLIDLFLRLEEIDFPTSSFSIDHVCYRVQDNSSYQKAVNNLIESSRIHISKTHHDRTFNLFFLKSPLVSNGREVFVIELSEPGGSDSYVDGFQHIEFHTYTDNIALLLPSSNVPEELLFSGKYGDESYLKWSDKTSVKSTKRTLIETMLMDESSRIVIIS